MDFEELNASIEGLDEESMEKARLRLDDIAKPVGSLGILEDAVVKLAGLTGNADVKIDKRAVLVFCADNGVVCQGVSQISSDVTALVAEHIARGTSSVCMMADIAGADVLAVDVGMSAADHIPDMVDRKIAFGTRDMSCEPAMTKEQAIRAIEVGIDMVRLHQDKGYNLLALGEMGIGNTTTSSAIAAVLLDRPVREVTGRGAGLSDAGLKRKVDVIERAVNVNKPDRADALDVLAKLGGFDIAALCGTMIGGAIFRIPIVLDGFISAVSALVASKLCPKAVNAMLASHVSAEPAAHMILDFLKLKPAITAEMRLGEGTGAVALLPLLDMALHMYHDMPTFSEIGMKPYSRQVTAS